MAAQFYARYIPPTAASRKATRDDTSDVAELYDRKRRKLTPQNDEPHGTQVSAGKERKQKQTCRRIEAEPPGDLLTVAQLSHFALSKQEKRSKSALLPSSGFQDIKADSSGNDVHQQIRQKYERSRQVEAKLAERQKKRQEEEQPHRELALETVETQGLRPLPQPAEVPDEPLRSTIQALPDWLAKPTFVKADATISFSDLGIDKKLVGKLSKQGFDHALAIQTTVLQMLLPGPKQHRGDVCVSAATGSGKTLAYTVPIVEALKDKPTKKLRAVVVVPTRELVGQVKEVFQQLDPHLEIGVAVGSKSLKEERAAFVRRDWRWDPEAYLAAEKKEQGENKWDWLEEDYEEDDCDCEEPLAYMPNMAADYRSRIDVLVCTPGRLVDHVQNTKGFTLQHVQWLVIDEADKLLDQSFQQWLDVIMPELEKESALELELAKMRMDYPLPHRPRIRKVILSATMAKDLDKLDSVNLCRPALVALQGDGLQIEPGSEVDASLVIPAQLTEFAVAVREVGDKPLYLLQLLQESLQETGRQESQESPSQNESSDMDTTSSSGSDTNDSTSSEVGSTSEADESLSEDDDSFLSDSSDESTPRKPAKSAITVGRKPSSGISESLYGMLIFTNTNENALRLCRLLALLRPSLSDRVSPLTKSSGSAAGRRVLAGFRKRKVFAIVASERASRGLDLKNLAQVVNYDMPTSVTSYVHRIGRTARAGASGTAITLVAHHEARWFWNEIARTAKIQRAGKVARKEVQLDRASEEDREGYAHALQQLGQEARGDKR